MSGLLLFNDNGLYLRFLYALPLFIIHGHYRMVVRFTTTCAISAYHH